MSASGDAGGAFLQNARTTKDWDERSAGRLATVRGLRRSPDDDLRRAVIQSIMCRMRLDLDELERDLGPLDFTPEWKALEPLAAKGLCTLSPRRLEVLPEGRLFLRHLAMAFDAYLAPREADPGERGPRFSQTV